MIWFVVSSAFSQEPPTVEFHGLVDSYYSHRFQGEPRAPSEGRLYDGPNDTFTIAYAELATDVAAGPAGLRIDLGFGQNADFGSFDPLADGTKGASEVFKHIEQAYVSYKLDKAPVKLQLDVGRFTTSAGSEVIEAKDNWLYSRTFLFNYAPFMHTGARATATWNEHHSTQISVVNGWEFVNDNNAHKTVGLSQTYKADHTLVALNLYSGIEADEGNTRRDFVDLVVGQSIGKVGLNLNAELGLEGGDLWYAAAAMVKVDATEQFRVTARGELFADPDGLRMGILDQQLVSLTLGGAYKVGNNAEFRLEGRQDLATEDVFAGGKLQTTLQAAALAWF